VPRAKIQQALSTLGGAGVYLAEAKVLLNCPKDKLNRGHLGSVISDLEKLEESIKELLHMVPNDK
jgi:hypothetical protein